MMVLLNNHGRSIMMGVLVMFAPRLMMGVLKNYDGPVMMLFPAIAMLVTDHLNAEQAIIDLRNAIGKGCCLGPAHEQASCASQKRERKFVHIHSSLLCPCAVVSNGVHQRQCPNFILNDRHKRVLVFGYDGTVHVACELHAEHRAPAFAGAVN